MRLTYGIYVANVREKFDHVHVL